MMYIRFNPGEQGAFSVQWTDGLLLFAFKSGLPIHMHKCAYYTEYRYSTESRAFSQLEM